VKELSKTAAGQRRLGGTDTEGGYTPQTHRNEVRKWHFYDTIR